MTREAQNLSREMILPAYKAAAIYVSKGASTIVENPLQIGQNMQNKAKVKIGKMNISIATIKDYDKNNEQPTPNVIQNKAKQSQS